MIVLDLSQDQLTRGNVLSDILQATGIYSEDNVQKTEQNAQNDSDKNGGKFHSTFCCCLLDSWVINDSFF